MKCPYCIKICSKCGELLVAYSGNYGRANRGKYGLRGECRKCRAEYKKQWKQEHKEQVRIEKKRYRESHKEQIKEYQEQWRQEHKEQIREADKRYRESHKEYYKEKGKQWRENNPDKAKEREKRYRENNPDKVFNNRIKRRQREELQGMGITKEQWLDMMKYFDWKCAYSGKPLKDNNRTIDHIKPLVKGGWNEIFNCVPCDRSVNSSKQHKDFIEWYKQQLFYSESRLNKIIEWQQYALETYYEYIKIS